MASVERRSGKRADVYVVRFRDDEGRSRSKTFGSHIEAIRFSNKVEVQLAEGDWIDPSRGREKFESFHKRWVAARSVSASRTYAEEGQAKNHIIPRWGNVSLAKIRPLDVAAWVKDGIEGGAHLKRDVLKQFKLCLDAAVREGILRKNPAAEVKQPPLPRKHLTASDVLEADELVRLAAAMPERWQAFIYLSGWLGWRWSEAMGLRVRDVDLDTGLLHLGRQVAVEVRGHVIVREGGKTAAATRTVPLPSAAIRALTPVVERRCRESGPNAPLWVTAAGTTPLRGNMSRIFQRAVTETGLAGRGLNIRQLRHTAASLMLAAGLDVLDVQNRLGHSDATTTLEIYSRVMSSRRTAGTALLDGVMGAHPVHDTALPQDASSDGQTDSGAIGIEDDRKAV